jgi:LuxR family maltose regulon positive regulatory protein
MLQRLEQANLFVVSLDNQREWYRYHPLFAEALRSQMIRIQSDLAPMLHYRASVWYAQNGHITEAILHAFNAHRWEWTADLIERLPITTVDPNREGRQELIPPASSCCESG